MYMTLFLCRCLPWCSIDGWIVYEAAHVYGEETKEWLRKQGYAGEEKAEEVAAAREQKKQMLQGTPPQEKHIRMALAQMQVRAFLILQQPILEPKVLAQARMKRRASECFVVGMSTGLHGLVLVWKEMVLRAQVSRCPY
jgi:hypothetical protein